MSRELFKSMTYKNGKVYTRQCSNNEYPKYYYTEENSGLTKIYNELGEKDFEKWFIANGVLQGTIVILGNSNKTLSRLKYLADMLWEDKEYNKLDNDRQKVFLKSLEAKTDEEKNIANEEYKKIEEDITKCVSSIYDEYNSKFKSKERVIELE